METEIEIWKDIEGYPGYQVSNMGCVKSLVKAYRRQEIILKGSPNTTGYILVQLYPEPRKRKSLLVHRLVMMTFQPNPAMEQLEVNHKDLDTTNNKMSNLEWVTEKENKAHYVASDKFKTVIIKVPKGEDQHLSKLTEEQVLEIRDIYPTIEYGGIKKVIASYGISRSAFEDIVKGRTWKHLLPEV
ncbi:NUMOD4 domain-containing protein [Robertmurraya sp.]|uniref:NUMOD4 domain-containing protein n=1 Tax=Robertmurraya sp. TaxID=2837525 RepID=UPI003704108A